MNKKKDDVNVVWTIEMAELIMKTIRERGMNHSSIMDDLKLIMKHLRRKKTLTGAEVTKLLMDNFEKRIKKRR